MTSHVKHSFSAGLCHLLIAAGLLTGIAAAAQEASQYTMQPSSKTMNKRLLIEDKLYKYLVAPPFLEKRPDPIVMHGFMSGMNDSAHKLYPQYFDGKEMPPADFIELRGASPLLVDSADDAIAGIANALNAINKSEKIKQVEISLVRPYLDHRISPTPWKDVPFEEIMQKHFGRKPADVIDSTGKSLSEIKDESRGKADEDYSRFDMDQRNYYLSNITKIVAGIEEIPNNRVFCWHCRMPNHNDWYIPMRGDNFYDYSNPTQDAFRKSLEKQYGNLDSLNKAWGATYQTFVEITAPKPKFEVFDCSRAWQDWQEFRRQDVYSIQQDTIDAIRKSDKKKRILSWMTTGIRTAARDQILLDDAMKLNLKNYDTLVALTWMDYFDFNGELFGQLALDYKAKVATEPGRMSYQSYSRTLYNCLRFPVYQINWLFFIAQKPLDYPQLTWVLNQRPLVDELVRAELIQEKTAYLFSYSDFLLRVPEHLWERGYFSDYERWFRAAQLDGLQLGIFTDYTLDPDLTAYKQIILPGVTAIRPEMLAKLADYVKRGGKLIVIGGKTGALDIDSGKEDYPLLRKLGIPGANESGTYKAGKGEVVIFPIELKDIVDKDNRFNTNGRKIIDSLEFERAVTTSPAGCGHFVKRNGDALYLGFINTSQGPFSCTADSKLLPPDKTVTGVELLNGEEITADKGKFTVTFEFQWQVKVVKFKLNWQNLTKPIIEGI